MDLGDEEDALRRGGADDYQDRVDDVGELRPVLQGKRHHGRYHAEQHHVVDTDTDLL